MAGGWMMGLGKGLENVGNTISDYSKQRMIMQQQALENALREKQQRQSEEAQQATIAHQDRTFKLNEADSADARQQREAANFLSAYGKMPGGPITEQAYTQIPSQFRELLTRTDRTAQMTDPTGEQTNVPVGSDYPSNSAAPTQDTRILETPSDVKVQQQYFDRESKQRIAAERNRIMTENAQLMYEARMKNSDAEREEIFNRIQRNNAYMQDLQVGQQQGWDRNDISAGKGAQGGGLADILGMLAASRVGGTSTFTPTKPPAINRPHVPGASASGSIGDAYAAYLALQKK